MRAKEINSDTVFACVVVSGIVGYPLARYWFRARTLLAPGKKVGATYWGVYQGVATSEPEGREKREIRHN